MNTSDPSGRGLMSITLALRQVHIIALALERHLGADSALVIQLREAHRLGADGFHTLCAGLVDLGVLDGTPQEAPVTFSSTH